MAWMSFNVLKFTEKNQVIGFDLVKNFRTQKRF